MAISPASPPGDPKDEGSSPEPSYPFEDLVAAILFIVIGAGAFWIAQDYPSGTMRRIGPGLFAQLISGLLLAIGLGLALQTLVSGKLKEVPRVMPAFSTVRALFFVMLSLAVFAVMIRPAGLFLATFVQVFISTRAEPGRKVIGSLILSLAIASLAAVIFIYGIGLPIPLWPR